MGKNSEIIKYESNDIAGIMKVLNQLSKKPDTIYFYNFANVYGPKKISSILNNRGFELYNITPDGSVDVVDKISKHIFNNISDRKYVNSLLYSPYYYTKYVQNPATNEMTPQRVWLAYNVLVDNKVVDIKNTYKIFQLKQLTENKDVVLLGMKEKVLTNELSFLENLCPVDKDFFATIGDGFMQKLVFPSIKYAGNPAILGNLASFEKQYPLLNSEITKVNKKIAQKVLAYEVENQQIVLNSALEKGQEQFKNLVNEYQSKAGKIQNLINLNEKLLSALGEKPKQTDFDFGKNFNDEL